MSGRAAAIPSAWKEARAAVANTAVDAGNNSRERTLLGSWVTEGIYGVLDPMPGSADRVPALA